MTGLHESTLALSVYNAIARDGAMTAGQALSYLKRYWDAGGILELGEVEAGIRYLESRKLVTVADETVAPAKLENGAARTVVRHPEQQTELVFGNGMSRISKGTALG
jgi:hypothetical protein